MAFSIDVRSIDRNLFRYDNAMAEYTGGAIEADHLVILVHGVSI
jgi:hypothetical protein